MKSSLKTCKDAEIKDHRDPKNIEILSTII